MAIQEVVDNREWVTLSGEPLGYVSHLRKDPLPGVPPKSVIYQFAKGDQNNPNPTMTALLRAGDLADRATFYRHDVAYAENPSLPKNPHLFLTPIGNPAFRPISLEAQRQIAIFFASNGTEIIQPEPERFFEVPIQGPLPEELNFIPASAPAAAPAHVAGSRASSPIPVEAAGGSPPISGLLAAPRLEGTRFDVTVQAMDVFGRVAFGYRGTVTFRVTDPDPAVMLPADYTFTADDQGTHRFTGEFTLITPGMWTLTAADLAKGLTQDVMLTVHT
jgi:hypothetical protein